MRIAIDSHTHSIASGHAYSTVDDLARGARKAGLRGFALTDHGPAIAGQPHPYHFGNLRVLPRIIDRVRVYRGVEANILDEDGSLDLEHGLLSRLDFVMAGLHGPCFPPRDAEANTRALVAALRSPLVDAISHPGNPEYPIDIEAVVAMAKEKEKAIELNSGSFRVRKGSEGNCLKIARLCAETETLVVCGSDAHYWRDVGQLDEVIALIKEARIPQRLVVNATVESFEAFIEKRTGYRRAAVKAKAAPGLE